MAIDMLSAERTLLLQQLLRQRGVAAVAPTEELPAKRAGAGPCPLSFAQERLWFLYQMAPESPVYNLDSASRLSGPLDLAVLARSFAEVVRRHEVLRTTFGEPDGEPLQTVHPPAPFPLPLVDLGGLGGLAGGTQAAEAERLARQEAARAFDLARGPLLRAAAVRLGPWDHLLLLTLHHIVADGWSMALLVRELGEVYGAFLARRASPLPELSLQYADFAVWQRRRLTGERLAAELAFWRQQLAGLASRLDLPTDRPRPAVQSWRGAALPFAIPEGLAARLRSLGRSHGATPFMVLLAGFAALLARWSGEDDLGLGTPIAGRNHPELEGLIGCFVNTLVLRIQVGDDASFARLLKSVRETSLSVMAHQEMPFEKLVLELRPERSTSHSPLFQVFFALQNAPRGEARLAGLTSQPQAGEETTAKFDLSLSFAEGEGGSAGLWSYSTDLFDPTTIARLHGRLERLLSGVAGGPERPLSGLPLLDPAELAQLLVEWNDTRVEAAADSGLHQLLVAQAARTPEAIAVLAREGAESYGELVRRAGRLARSLRALGVGTEVRVGVLLERSLDLVTALVAVLAAGGAYVPLDPAYPASRLAFMLESSAAALLLTRRGLFERAGLPTDGVRPVFLDAGWEGGLGDGEPALPPSLPASLAYVLFTSGSTGRPKGVAVTQASAVALLRWIGRAFPPADLAGVLAATSICFDLSVFELFGPLAWGGTVVLAENVLELAELPGAAAVSLINTVPSALAELLGMDALPPGVRTVNLAGEPLPGTLAAAVYRLPEARRVVNLYGPSEDTTYSTCGAVPYPVESAPSIGRPIAGTRAYLLDADLLPVPLGAQGELYLGGAGLARGYLGRPDLTAERFLPDPFATLAGEPGGRVYRTGDLARHRVDGTLSFLGRIDHQVKIRGFRIELGEIESTLVALPGVREAVVMVHEAGPGDRRLVAYLAGPAGQAGEISPQELRRELRERLPEYMVPAAFVPLAALPRNPSGKVDRKALPAPEWQGREGERGAAGLPLPPRDELELRLVGMWKEILGVQPVGVLDDFFALGGHSLLAARLAARIRTRLGRELPLASLLRAPTVAGLAALLRLGDEPAERRALVEIQPGGDRRPLFAVHPVGGEVLCYLDLARALGPLQPVFGLQAGALAGETKEPTIEAMAAAYLAEIRTVQPQGPYRLAGWSMGGLVAFEMARQLTRRGEAVELLAVIDVPAPPATPSEVPDEWSLLGQFANDLWGVSGRDLELPAEIPTLGGPELLRALVDFARAEQILPSDLDFAAIHRRFELFSANVGAMARYVAGSYPGRLLLVRSRSSEPAFDSTLGWGDLATGGVEVLTSSGDHFSIVRGPHVEGWAGALA
jgi:amino acid adenylation domain-containing protein